MIQQGKLYSAKMQWTLRNPLSRRKKARTKRNHEGEKIMSFAKVMDELAGLCHLVVAPKISVDKIPEVIMVEKMSPTQQQVLNLLGTKPV